MPLGTAVAIYFVIWWIVLFATLPFGVRTQEEAGEIVAGAPASAPHRIVLWKIALRNTIVATVVFAFVYWLLVYSGLKLTDIPVPGFD
ncbi:MAG: DUF1467 family protein [Hyphomicrobiaceae bacterium]|nr:DUF1467 family protein [Hyphomicrobiaceae bacterium]